MDPSLDPENMTLSALRASLLPHKKLFETGAVPLDASTSALTTFIFSDPQNEHVLTSLNREQSRENLIMGRNGPLPSLPPLDRQRSQRDLQRDQYMCCVKVPGTQCSRYFCPSICA